MTTPSPPRISPTDLLDRPAGGGGGGPSLRGLLPSLLLSAIVPFIVYTGLTGQGVADVPALIVSGLFPVLGVVWSLVRTRRASRRGAAHLAEMARAQVDAQGSP